MQSQTPAAPAAASTPVRKSYNYAQLEAVAQEMRANPDMVFFYEYQRPSATLPNGQQLDLVAEFGEPRSGSSVPRLAPPRPARRRLPAHPRWPRSTPSNSCRTRPARSGR